MTQPAATLLALQAAIETLDRLHYMPRPVGSNTWTAVITRDEVDTVRGALVAAVKREPRPASWRPPQALSSNLARAIYLAAGAHSGQIDKGGAPYIQHVLRVMLAMTSEDDMIVAVLHDILEDGRDWTAQRLLDAGVAPHLVAAISALTRADGESYDDFIGRVAQNEIARRVKIADLADNSLLSRIHNPGPTDHQRLRKYARAAERLVMAGMVTEARQPDAQPSEGEQG